MAIITSKNKPLERHEVTITYLEQWERPSFKPIAPPPFKTALMRMEKPSLAYYRFLFDAVGREHRWVSRRYLSDEDLKAIIHDDDVQLYGLYKEGWPAGFAEVNTKTKNPLDFKFFGLIPEVQGEGMGAWFLQEMLGLIWAQDPERVIIETCTLDHPGALRLYQRMGFTVYDQGTGLVEWHG